MSQRSARSVLTGSAIALMVAALLSTSWIASQSPGMHAGLMQQLGNSGLIRPIDHTFESGWLTASSHGAMLLSEDLCAGCGALEYVGTVNHGMGAWLKGKAAWASLDYRIHLPELPLQPALPKLELEAWQAFAGLQAALRLAASSHMIQGPVRRYQLEQDGLQGRLEPTRLRLQSPGWRLARNQSPFIDLEGLRIQAHSRDTLDVTADIQRLHLPAWQWSAYQTRARYQQAADGQQVDLELELAWPVSELNDESSEQATRSELRVTRLHLPASQAFARELPRLLSPKTSPAGRMLGLLSLYSVHGPAFFGAGPALRLVSEQLPLTDGPMDIDIQLAVKPGLRRPPMHPREWQQALSGHVDIRAPREQLQALWNQVGSPLSYITGLPSRYSELQRQGWVGVEADGRERLYFQLHATRGLIAGL